MTDIGKMLADMDRRLKAVERASRLSKASIDDTALEVRDGTGSLRGILGQQADGTTAVNIVNGGPPPAPSTPTAEPALGGIGITWDGTFADGQVIPLDWARTEVHASTEAAFTPSPDTLRATIETAQGGIVYTPSPDPLYVALLARNTSGTASEATAVVGPYAPKPVAGELGPGAITETHIADGAVTTPKVYANAITTALLAAGSVDATALKADAITGKVITGGTINGAEFHSDDGAGGLVDIESGSIVATASTGWKAVIDPTGTVPAIGFLNSLGDTAGVIEATGTDSQPALTINSGMFADGPVTDWVWNQYIGQGTVNNFWRVRRVSASDVNVVTGGYFFAGHDRVQVAFVDTQTAGADTYLEITDGQIRLVAGRVLVQPNASANSAFFVNTASGHTGNVARFQLNGADKLVVGPTGDTTITGATTMTGNVGVTGNLTATGKVAGQYGDYNEEGTWSTVSFNSWVQTTHATYQTLRVSRGLKRARLDGVGQVGTAIAAGGTQSAFTVPAGYRPLKEHYYAVPNITGGSPAHIGCRVGTDGVVTIWSTAAVSVGALYDFTRVDWPLN
ncbi:hypothetical protein [Streptomyces sp. t39]|uniref:hypothetical protein n=1 Tax=Streptomyces sp. t39 TaxID=1828156 RepID=UPI0011CE8186|nr:hypothetical protein [Streptomyces sp. t39]TXS39697.1 hypothetical protein EAO77_36125 [Streptomyces sp. t39]